MEVRRATPDDAEEICAALRASIAELCAADHNNDPIAMGQWLANKTPENVATWIADPEARLLVAVEDGRICGVASGTTGGEVNLNYVSPHARFRGASAALISSLEEWMKGLGVRRVTLTSTRTAHRFYLARGYQNNGPPQPWRGNDSQPMAKDL